MRKQVHSKEITEDCCELQANMMKNMSCDENECCSVERKLSREIGGDSIALFNTPGASPVCEASGTQGPPQSNTLWTKRMNSCHKVDNMVRNSSLSSEGNDKVYPESIVREESCVHHSAVTGSGSPVKQ